MNAVPRIDVPTGTVPALKSFIRHVWRYRDEHGDTMISAPPGNVLTIVLDDQNEADVAMTTARYISTNLGFEDRISSEFCGPHVLIGFRDLAAVHTFLTALSMQADRPPAREIVSFWLSMLGFRWT